MVSSSLLILLSMGLAHCAIFGPWCYGILVLNKVLVAGRLNLPGSCLLCNGPSKSIIHVLRDCSIAQQVWNSLFPPMLPNLFFGINLLDWLRLNCKSQQPCALGIPLGILFPIGVWNLWLHRNKEVFKNEAPNKIYKSNIIAKAVEYAFLGVNESKKRILGTIFVKWEPPSQNWHKLNTDGFSLGNPGCAGGGGII